jgi:hypothetical protein
VIAHIGGLPVEESLLQLAPAGVGLLIGLQVALARFMSRLRRDRR